MSNNCNESKYYITNIIDNLKNYNKTFLEETFIYIIEKKTFSFIGRNPVYFQYFLTLHH